SQVEHLLSVLPKSAHVVLSSRRDPPIKLHQLRLAGELAEIRADDLRFTEAEAHELLAASGIRLSDGATAALYERTEGWAAGLRLAVISLSGHADPERFVAEFSGTSCWWTSCASTSGEGRPTRFLTSTAGPPGGSATTGTPSRASDTRSRPGTGPMRHGCSPTTWSA